MNNLKVFVKESCIMEKELYLVLIVDNEIKHKVRVLGDNFINPLREIEEEMETREFENNTGFKILLIDSEFLNKKANDRCEITELIDIPTYYTYPVSLYYANHIEELRDNIATELLHSFYEQFYTVKGDIYLSVTKKALFKYDNAKYIISDIYHAINMGTLIRVKVKRGNINDRGTFVERFSINCFELENLISILNYEAALNKEPIGVFYACFELPIDDNFDSYTEEINLRLPNGVKQDPMLKIFKHKNLIHTTDNPSLEDVQPADYYEEIKNEAAK